jgi:hypothetical protein
MQRSCAKVAGEQAKRVGGGREKWLVDERREPQESLGSLTVF